MPWSTYTKIVTKAEADAAIDALKITTEDPKDEDQLRVAKQAAKLMVSNIPGPCVYVFLCGHANGVGWHEREGWPNDNIQVTIKQSTEAT